VSPQTVGALVDSAIPFAAGLYCTLVGYGVVSASRSPESVKYQEWRKKYGTFMKWGGPLMMFFAIARLAAALAGRPL
jgi:hypothetical protein